MTSGAQDKLQSGAVVLQQWQLIRPLGEGGMGSVWEATSLRLERRVAIKFLSRQHLHDARLHERFQREAKAISKIRSPHVVQILDHGVFEDHTPFIVTELLDGEDLGRLLDREGRLSVAETGAILDQLCRGLAKVHAAGLVHRDIKPENVFILDEGDGRFFVKLVDFGVAKALDSDSLSMTAQDNVVGTAHYVSPEQITSPNQIDHRVDIWALGVLTHRMLTGVVAFEADNWPTLCAILMKPPAVSARSHQPSLPQAVDDWLGRTLQADPKLRFQTAEEARSAFERITRAHSSGVIPRTPAESMKPQGALVPDLKPSWNPSRPSLRAAGFVLAALALAAIAFWFGARRAATSASAPAPAPTETALPVVRPVEAHPTALPTGDRPVEPAAALPEEAPATEQGAATAEATPPAEATPAETRAPPRAKSDAAPNAATGRKYRGF